MWKQEKHKIYKILNYKSKSCEKQFKILYFIIRIKNCFAMHFTPVLWKKIAKHFFFIRLGFKFVNCSLSEKYHLPDLLGRL